MKCAKCNYITFEYYKECPKCKSPAPDYIKEIFPLLFEAKPWDFTEDYMDALGASMLAEASFEEALDQDTGEEGIEFELSAKAEEPLEPREGLKLPGLDELDISETFKPQVLDTASMVRSEGLELAREPGEDTITLENLEPLLEPSKEPEMKYGEEIKKGGYEPIEAPVPLEGDIELPADLARLISKDLREEPVPFTSLKQDRPITRAEVIDTETEVDFEVEDMKGLKIDIPPLEPDQQIPQVKEEEETLELEPVLILEDERREVTEAPTFGIRIEDLKLEEDEDKET